MRRRVIRATLGCALLLILALGTAPMPASASGSFTFYGSGDGHGIGMSQWGAYGLAQMGWTHQRIVEHFFKGTKVVTSAPLPGRIRVGLTSGRTSVHLRAQAGPVRLWIGHPGRTVGRRDPVGRHVDRARTQPRLRGPPAEREARRRPRLGRSAREPDRHVSGSGVAGVHPRGRRDLVPRLLLQARLDRDEPHELRRRERLCRATDRAPGLRGLPAGPRRGARVVADGGDAGAGGGRPLLRRIRRAALSDPQRLQLRPHRRLLGPDLHRLQPRGGHRRRTMGQGRPLDRP